MQLCEDEVKCVPQFVCRSVYVPLKSEGCHCVVEYGVICTGGFYSINVEVSSIIMLLGLGILSVRRLVISSINVEAVV